MDLHYNAFISYRHLPKDIKVASMVQQSLEHYRIPGNIQKQYGLKRIERVFRDKEELPITSDLNKDISQALENSDYLIVICSTETKKSLWVLKEIEVFLRTHSKNRVLTVLVDGEPGEVIPEVLLSDVIEETGRDGTPSSRQIQLEPFSCDVRVNPRKQLKSELHRLAAALIGCPYDILYQRQKKYQRRKRRIILTTVISGLSILAAYFLWSSIQIQKNYLRAEENYQQSLENQSKYLASESLTSLEEGDRLTAVQLALAALPSDNLPRPTVPEAEYAMSQALYAYSEKANLRKTVNSYSHSGEVKQFYCMANGLRLWVLDSLGNLYLWNTEDYTLIKKFEPSDFDTIIRIFRNKDCLLVASFDHLYCLDSGDGSLLWEREAVTSSPSIHSLNDGKEIAYIESTGTGEKIFDALTRIDARTGMSLEQISLDRTSDTDPSEPIYAQLAWQSSSGILAVASYPGTADYGWRSSDTMCKIQFRDITTAWKTIEVPGQHVDALEFTSDGNLLAIVDSSENGVSARMDANTTEMVSLLYNQNLHVLCLSPDDLSINWEYDIQHSLFGENHASILMYPNDDGTECEAVCITSANKSYLFRCKDGELLKCCELPSAAVHTDIQSGQIEWILESGDIARWMFHSDYIYSSTAFVSNLSAADRSNDNTFVSSVYTLDNQTILQYGTIPPDPNWTMLTGENASGAYINSAISSKYFIYQFSRNSDYLQCLLISDLGKGGENRILALEEPGHPNQTFDFLGFTRDCEEALLFRHSSTESSYNAIVHVSLTDNTLLTTPLPGINAGQGCGYSAKQNVAVYLSEGDLYRYDPESGEISGIPLTLPEGAGIKRCHLSPSADYMLLHVSEPTAGSSLSETKCYLLNTQSGTCTPVEEPSWDYYETDVCFSPDDRFFAIGDSSHIFVYDASGKRISDLTLNGKKAESLHFSPSGNQLYVLYSGKLLSCYDTAAFSLCKEIQLPDRSTSANHWYDVEWIPLDDNLLSIHYKTSNLAILLDQDHWTYTGILNANRGYWREGDAFLTAQVIDGTAHIGLIPRYTVPMLTQAAEALLQGRTMTEQQLVYYGLS